MPLYRYRSMSWQSFDQRRLRADLPPGRFDLQETSWNSPRTAQDAPERALGRGQGWLLIRETVVEGEPVLEVDTAEDLNLTLTSGVYILAPDDVRADYGLTETANSDTQDIVDESDWRDAAWLGEAEDSPGWVIRRLWALVPRAR